MKYVLNVAFRVSLALFLLGGMLLVALQAIGLVAGSGSLVIETARRLGPPTYALASVSGLLGFARSYLEEWKLTD